VAETEALGATVLRGIVASELADLLPEPLVSVHGRERAKQDELLAALAPPHPPCDDVPA